MEEEKADEGRNGFGDNTYWNRRPTGRRPRKLPSKYPSLKRKAPTRSETGIGLKTSSRPTSPTLSHLSLSNAFSRAHVSPPRFYQTMNPSMDTDEENDAKDEKSIVKLMKSKLPQFSNEAD